MPQAEAGHVAFGIAHLQRHLRHDLTLAARRGRMLMLGFTPDVAAELAGLHTRNFM